MWITAVTSEVMVIQHRLELAAVDLVGGCFRLCCVIAFSALSLLVRRQKEHLACKN